MRVGYSLVVRLHTATNYTPLISLAPVPLQSVFGLSILSSCRNTTWWSNRDIKDSFVLFWPYFCVFHINICRSCDCHPVQSCLSMCVCVCVSVCLSVTINLQINKCYSKFRTNMRVSWEVEKCQQVNKVLIKFYWVLTDKNKKKLHQTHH